jgi:hypothetical protein
MSANRLAGQTLWTTLLKKNQYRPIVIGDWMQLSNTACGDSTEE